MSVNREIELKGTIRPEHLDRVKGLSAIKKCAVGRARSRKLVTVYFDTPDHELRRLGLSLRVRKVGRAYVQCVKGAHKKLGGILVRTEWEGPVPSQDPAISVIEDKRLRQLIRRVGVKHLQPVFRTDIQRSSRTLKFDDGSTVSLDIDVGEIVAGDVSEPIGEFELELESGAPERLFDLASEIRKDVPFRLATLSKASRGYALLTQDGPKPQKYVKLTLEKDATVEQVLTELVQHCLDHLQANEAVVLKTDDTEGVHQMRVAWREQPVTERTTRLLDPIGDHCVKLLQKRDRDVRRQGRDVANLSEAALHELRLAVKRLRYAVDFFESLYPKKQTKAYRKHLAGLQDGLGYLNDVAAADTLLRELGDGDGNQAPPAWAYTGGVTVGWHRHAAIATRQSLVKDIAAFLRTKPFWHGA